MTPGPPKFPTGFGMEDENTKDEHQIELPAKRIRCSFDVDDVGYSEGRATVKRREGGSPVPEYAADLGLNPGAVDAVDVAWSWRYSPAPIIDSQPLPYQSTPPQPEFCTQRHRLRAAETNTGVSGPSQRQKQLQNNFNPLSAATNGLPVGKSSNIGLPGSPPSSSLDFTKVLGEFAAHHCATSAPATGEGIPKKSRQRGRRRWGRGGLNAGRFLEKTATPGSVSTAVSSLGTTAMPEPCSDTVPTVASQKARNDAAGLPTPSTRDTGPTTELTHKNGCHSGRVTGSPAGSSPAATTITDERAKEQCHAIGCESTSNSLGVRSGANSTTISPRLLVPRLSGNAIPWRGNTANEPIVIGDDEPVGVAGGMVYAEVVTLVKDEDLVLSTEDQLLEADAAQANIPISSPDGEGIITIQDEQILVSGGGKVNANPGPVPSLDPSPGVRASTHTALILAPQNASLSATAALPSVAPDLYPNPNLLPRPGLTFCTTVPYVTGPLSRFIHFHITSSLLDLLTLICLKHALTSHQRSCVSRFYMTYDDNTLVIDLCDPDCEWDWEAWMGSVGNGGGVVCVNVMLGSNPVNRYISAPGHLIRHENRGLE